MKILLIILGVIATIIVFFVIYRLIAFRRESMQHSKKKHSRIQPLLTKLEAGEVISAKEIESLAQQPTTREDVYYLLKNFGKEDLFPQSQYSIEKFAESNLVNWLEFPTELGTLPNQVELLQSVKVKEEKDDLLYLVYRFRTKEPHWAAKDGWMLGVVGPYTPVSKPFDSPVATFSRLSKLIDITPEQEVAWVNENIMKRAIRYS